MKKKGMRTEAAEEYAVILNWFAPPGNRTSRNFNELNHPVTMVLHFHSHCRVFAAGLFSVLLFAAGSLRAQVIMDQPASVSGQGNPPSSHAALDLDYTDRGFLPPRLTAAQRDALATPVPAGLTIYNTDVRCLQFHNGSEWVCAGSCVPDLPDAGAHGSTASQITWNWSAATGAEGYRWHTSDDFAAATDIENTLSLVQTGLQSNTAYVIYLWAYNECGRSSARMLSHSTPFECGTSTVAVNHAPTDGVSAVTRSVTYGTVDYQSRCWTDRNLGALAVPVSASDASEANAGWYWQFNRRQGRQNTGGSSNTPAWTISGDNAINENSEWLASQDPCTLLLGSSWRLPSGAEWIAAESGWNSYSDSFGTALKLHAAGRIFSTGSLDSRGLYGLYWGGTQYSSQLGSVIDFGPSFCYTGQWPKATGATVRCIRN
jgi:hypothetical protein